MSSQHGFVVIDKPSGITSHDVVARLRKRLGTKQIGHAGTLDPMATGVLVLGVNNATKFLDYIVQGRKRYTGNIRLGQSTTTDDREGEVISSANPLAITDEEIRRELGKFVGTIMQAPSSVSAIKVDGRRAYDRVRSGEKVELPEREVRIYSLEIIEMTRDEFIDITIDVSCSAGTYIRAIARDLGVRLGVGGHLTSLRRTEVAPFTLNECVNLENPSVIPLVDALKGIMPCRIVTTEEIKELRFGRTISRSEFSEPGIALADNGEVIAIIKNVDDKSRPTSVFNS
mgnify:FL=1